MKYIFSLTLIIFSFWACKSETKKEPEIVVKDKTYKKFGGNYNKSFNDLHDLHTAAAVKNGISPLRCRKDVESHMNALVFIPKEIAIFKTDSLKYSIPYLVPAASQLLTQICINFRDSLISKKITQYKPIITSITRTDEDVALLTKRNGNASDSSVHRYATTFDISWRRFQKVQTSGTDVDSEKLKFILAQVLFDLRERDRCYIKHERKQACFHITVR